MELTLPYSKATLNHVNAVFVTPTNNTPSSSPNHIQFSLLDQHVKKKNTTPYSGQHKTFVKNKTNPSIQVQLPLHRPQLKPHQPTEKTTTFTTFDLVHKNAAERKKTTTCSDILNLMDCLNLPTSLDLYISLIKECTKTRDHFQAIKLHNHITANRIRPSLHLLNRLLLMYVSCECFAIARCLFDKMPVRNLSAWAVMIAGCVENGEYEEAMRLFMKMRCEYEFTCEYDDAIDFMVSGIVVCVLKACAETMSVELGEQIQGWITKLGYSKNLVLSSFLIRFYGKLGCLRGGDVVFDHVSPRNTVVWTARIANCCNAGRFERAINVFKEMGREGVKKNGYTFSSVLKACGEAKDGGFCGRQVHASAIKLRLDSDGYVQCALIDMYGKSGLVQEARRVFETIGEKRNDASWNALLTGYVLHGYRIEAIKLLYEMKAAGLRPPGSLLNILRLVCGSCITENETDNILSVEVGSSVPS